MSNLTPAIPYLREPFYEVGRKAVTILTNNYLLGEDISDIDLQPELYHGVHAIPL